MWVEVYCILFLTWAIGADSFHIQRPTAPDVLLPSSNHPGLSRPWGSILCCFHCVPSQRRGQDAHQIRLSLLFFRSLKWILGSIVSSCANSTWDVKVQLLWLLSFDVWPWRCQWIKSMSTNKSFSRFRLTRPCDPHLLSRCFRSPLSDYLLSLQTHCFRSKIAVEVHHKS